METVKIYYLFNKLCLLYHDLTIEYNKIYSDNQRCLYFKDQYPNVYQEFMKFFSIVPCKENMNLLAKYIKPIDDTCHLVKLIKENNIDNLYDETEYINICKRLISWFISSNGTNLYESLLSVRYPKTLIYVYLKLLTQKLENTSDSDKKYLLNYILYLLKNHESFKSFELSNNSTLLEKYKSLPEINELETNKYYQMLYNLNDVNYGGCITDMFNICPLHLTDTQEKNISLNKTFTDSNQISRGNNKKLLSDKNYINLQYLREEYDYNMTDMTNQKYIVGDKVDYDYINNKILKIMNKYKVNNKFNLDLMIEKLYEEIIDIYTKIPTKQAYAHYTWSIFYDSVFVVDKEIDRKYFDGKLSYFAKFIIAMSLNNSPNDKICSEYILSNIINRELGKDKEQAASLYMMIKYMEDQFNTWLDKIKPLLGLDDEWNYDESKDTIRNKIIKNDPKLIEKYDQLMNINYLKIYTLDPLLDNYDKYNILKTFGKSFEFLISKILSIESYKNLGSYSITDKESGESITINEILTNIKDDNKKSTYLNNEFINNYGFKKYFLEMLKDFKNENSVKIYTKLEDYLYCLQLFSHPINHLTSSGVDNFFNDYTYEYIQLYNNCSQCMEELYKLNIEGFYKTFEEINTLKQYQELEDTKNTTTEENKQNIESVEVSLNDIFEDDGVTLKVDIKSFERSSTYYYTVDEYCEASIDLKNGSYVITYQDNKYKGVMIMDTPSEPWHERPQQATVELGFNNIISAGSKFIGENAKDIINKMKFYKSRTISQGKFENGKTFIIANDYYYSPIYTVMGDKFMQYNRRYTTLSNSGAINHSTTTSKDSVYNQYILYTSDISDSEYIGEYLITKEDNYAYPIESIEKLEKLIFTGNNNNYIIYNNMVSLLSKDQYYVRVAPDNVINFSINGGSEIELYGTGKTLSNDVINNLAYKNNISMVEINSKLFNPVIHIEGAKFNYKGILDEISEYDDEEKEENKRPISKNNNGYVIFRDADTKKPLLLIITNEEKFKEYISKNIYSLHFNYVIKANNTTVLEAFDGYKLNEKITNEEIINSFLVLNKPEITFKDNTTEQGISLDNNLVIYDWKYNINNVNIVTLKDNIYKEEIDLIEGQHLQKEFSVKDFNKLMLRKCFPDNFKRTLLCNQDVLDAVDGSKYSIPDIKIKEALCEYGKYPYYLEHYFMTSKIDYKLKGKFNLRCIANLSVLPDIVFKYLDKDDLDYISNEIIIQGEDIIVKDGKIISKGDVYLVGIELANDMMFKVPPSKILNKALLDVIDFQQFDNIYDRVELLLDNSGITDYIVKPLRLENIGTLKNMKYINFY